MDTTSSPPLPICAKALFVSSVQQSDRLPADDLRSAISRILMIHGGHRVDELVAQEAGDHPELYQRRMQWALRSAALAYSTAPRATASSRRSNSGHYATR
jgi:hypothetical protein